MVNEEDSGLVASAQAGDVKAYGVLVRKYQGMLYSLALNMTGSAEDAEDIVQSGFISIYEKLADFDGSRSFRNWAYTIVLNRTRNSLRRKKLVRFFSLDSFSSDDGAPAQIADSSQDTEAKARQAELLRAIDSGLLKLPVEQREAFILFHFHDNSVGEIAALAGTTVNAVSIRLYRARAALAAALGGRLVSEEIKP